MPEWVINHVSVTGEESYVDSLVHAVANHSQDLVFDFNRIIPMPSWVHEKPWKGPYRQDPFDWRERHWGTSRNADLIHWKRDLDIAEYTFHTAWIPPDKVARELRELFPALQITWSCTFPGKSNPLDI